jgi:hypothetical protein
VNRAVLASGTLPLAMLGVDSWPANTAVQIHYGAENPHRNEEWVQSVVASVRESGAPLEVHTQYPAAGHLFTDPTLPDYDANAAELFCSACSPSSLTDSRPSPPVGAAPSTDRWGGPGRRADVERWLRVVPSMPLLPASPGGGSPMDVPVRDPHVRRPGQCATSRQTASRRTARGSCIGISGHSTLRRCRHGWLANLRSPAGSTDIPAARSLVSCTVGRPWRSLPHHLVPRPATLGVPRPPLGWCDLFSFGDG